jgi:predicted GNAT superfamily acetyltransferase
MERDMKLALEWRRATRAVFTTYLPRGYEVRELVRGERTSDYVLAPVAT